MKNTVHRNLEADTISKMLNGKEEINWLRA